MAELKADFDARGSERNGILTQLVAKRAALDALGAETARPSPESKRRLRCIFPEVPNCRT